MTDPHDPEIHPIRARSGGMCVRFMWPGTVLEPGDHECQTIGWHFLPPKGDRVKANGGVFTVTSYMWDADEPNCVTVQLR